MTQLHLSNQSLRAATALSVALTAAALCLQPGTAAAQTIAPGPTTLVAAPYQCVTNVYVDASRGNDSNAGTEASPWATIQNADNGYPNTPQAGECVNVEPGTYTLSRTLIAGHGGNANTKTGYVVYRSVVQGQAHIVAAAGINQWGGDMIILYAPYLVFDGFEIDGSHAMNNGAGINGCAYGGQLNDISHHFTAINNTIHDVGGAGLSTCVADFITWSHNLIYNTSSTNPYEVSGIDVWKPLALAPGSYTPTKADTIRRFGIIVSSNIVHDNAEGPSIPGNHTDGNGIIIDTTFGSVQCPTCGTPYTGKILVNSNVAFNNGGGGIHIFLSENVVVANNTCYNNYLDQMNNGTGRGELSSVGSQNVVWLNNIAYAVPGANFAAYNKPAVSFTVGSFPTTARWMSNLTYGATNSTVGGASISPDQNLVNVAPQLINPVVANFVPQTGSPVIAAGTPRPFITGSTPDIGAY